MGEIHIPWIPFIPAKLWPLESLWNMEYEAKGCFTLPHKYFTFHMPLIISAAICPLEGSANLLPAKG